MNRPYIVMEMNTGYVDGVYLGWDNASSAFQGYLLDYPKGAWVFLEVIESPINSPIMIHSRSFYMSKLDELSKDSHG